MLYRFPHSLFPNTLLNYSSYNTLDLRQITVIPKCKLVYKPMEKCSMIAEGFIPDVREPPVFEIMNL